MRTSRKHSRDKEALKQEIEGQLLPRLMDQYGQTVSNPTHAWQGDSLGFSFQTRGFTIRGRVDVSDDEVAVDVSLPLLARLFEGRIRSEAEQFLDEFLS